MKTKQGISNQVSGAGSTGGSSFPSSVKYFNGIAVNKVGGPNTAIAGPTSIAVKFIASASIGAVDGGLSTTPTGVAVTDGTNIASLATTLPATGEDVVVVVELYPSDKNIMRLARIYEQNN